MVLRRTGPKNGRPGGKAALPCSVTRAVPQVLLLPTAVFRHKFVIDTDRSPLRIAVRIGPVGDATYLRRTIRTRRQAAGYIWGLLVHDILRYVDEAFYKHKSGSALPSSKLDLGTPRDDEDEEGATDTSMCSLRRRYRPSSGPRRYSTRSWGARRIVDACNSNGWRPGCRRRNCYQ